MSIILVIGGSGFIGSHVVARLAQEGHELRVPTRLRQRARQLLLLPTVNVPAADVHDDRALDQLVTGVDAVVNLAGVLNSRAGNPYGRDFAQAHVALPRRILDACYKAGVRRLIHFSALGAKPDAPSEYLRSKAAGEEVLIAARARIDATVLRPSVVFGPEDRFLNLFAALIRWFPAMLLACPKAKFQPVHVADVAECVARCLWDRSSIHHHYDLCGPKVYTLRELVKFAGEASGRRRPVIGLPERIAYLQAWAMEWLPVKLLTRDNLRSMQVPCVSDAEFPFGIRPQSMEGTAPAWLARVSLQSPYDGFRCRAGR
ncbi:MAG: complex I NDUFA9 subunit family protein [Betaproteobacteria bacterium]|nr:complex I NDUFA9 subunit family protein [Betaproteobacteria bacterium]